MQFSKQYYQAEMRGDYFSAILFLLIEIRTSHTFIYSPLFPNRVGKENNTPFDEARTPPIHDIHQLTLAYRIHVLLAYLEIFVTLNPNLYSVHYNVKISQQPSVVLKETCVGGLSESPIDIPRRARCRANSPKQHNSQLHFIEHSNVICSQ